MATVPCLNGIVLQGVNIMQFCKEYNAATQDKIGTVIPAEITVYEVRMLYAPHFVGIDGKFLCIFHLHWAVMGSTVKCALEYYFWGSGMVSHGECLLKDRTLSCGQSAAG